MTWNFLKKKVTVPGKPEEETITYRRKKAKGKRQAIFQQFKPEVIHHELMGDACTCPDCHEKLKEIGSCVQPTRISLRSCTVKTSGSYSACL